MPKSLEAGRSTSLSDRRGNVENQADKELFGDLTLKERGEKVSEKVHQRREQLRIDQEMEDFAKELLGRYESSENKELLKRVEQQTRHDDGVLLAWIWDIEKEQQESKNNLQ